MLNKRTKVYLVVIYICSFLSLFFSYLNRNTNDILDISTTGFFLFSLLSVVAESFPVVFNKLSVSAGFAITFACIYLFDAFTAIIIISLGVIFRVYKFNNKYYSILNMPFYKVLFNLSNIIISIFCSSKLTNVIINKVENPVYYAFFKFLLITITFLLINSLIISILMSFITKDNFLKLYLNNVNFGLLNIFSMAPLGYFLAYLYKNSNIVGILVVTIIILFARYTFMLYIESKTKYQETIKVLMNALEMRDKYTEGHSRNVADIVKAIGRELGYSESHIEELELAAYLHDIGKIGIPDYILNKPGKLTEEEYAKIKEHPAIGYDIVKDIKGIGNIPELVRHHHERYDGAGYPDGKKRDELSIDVYILQLADSVDAMQAKRVYKNSLNTQEIKEEVLRCRGTQFHPKVVDIYLKICERENLCNMRG
ncbi:MAG: hypothetical protein JG776_258 [Caloramator sp.]|uniref:HD-GYP domain-containing protein n=1 Tax=Caloramator sp. TaxID=1871330 RepID=UPI001E19D798|nr:HD-GYP domain-containing protein [Caloramator sp.]MBZ4662576.1 hypothetical protein [Caloramator sp.]